MDNDREIINKILSGDSNQVRQLYGEVSGRLKSYFGKQVQRPEDVDELIQDTFLHFLDALPLFQYQSSLMTFVHSIAHHELMDYWRKKYAKRVVRTVPLLKNLSMRTKTSGDTAAHIHEAIQRAYARLKPLQSKMLRMKYEEEMSVKEIAEVFGMSVKAAEAQLYRARKSFQEVFDGQQLDLAWLHNETN